MKKSTTLKLIACSSITILSLAFPTQTVIVGASDLQSSDISTKDTSATYNAAIVWSQANGIPPESNTPEIKSALTNAGITQQTVDDGSHIFNNNSTQASYRVGLNPSFNYSRLIVMPESDLIQDAPLTVVAAAYVSGSEVKPLSFTRNTDGTTTIDLSALDHPNGYVIYAVQPLRSDGNGDHIALHVSLTSDFEIFASDSSGVQYVNGTLFTAEHPNWGTLWGIFRDRTKLGMLAEKNITAGDQPFSLAQLVTNYEQYKNGEFEVFDSDGKTLGKALSDYTFNVAGRFYVRFVTQLANGDYIWNTTVVTVINPVKGANVTVNYVDTNGIPISSSTILSGNVGDTFRTTPKVIPGYTLSSVVGDTSGIFSERELNINYVYTKNAPIVTTETKTVNETIHYVYKDGGKALDDYVATPLTFTRTVSTDAVTGAKTYGAWSTDQSFAAVKSPDIKGYTADPKQIAAQTVNANSDDLTFTVSYTKNGSSGTQVTLNNPSKPEIPSKNDPTLTPSDNFTASENLPETGESQNANLIIMGLIALVTVSLAGLLKFGNSKRE